MVLGLKKEPYTTSISLKKVAAKEKISSECSAETVTHVLRSSGFNAKVAQKKLLLKRLQKLQAF